MLNLDQITEQGVSLDLQGLVILKDRKIRTQKSTDREQVSSGDRNKGVKRNQSSLFWIHLQNMQADAPQWVSVLPTKQQSYHYKSTVLQRRVAAKYSNE